MRPGVSESCDGPAIARAADDQQQGLGMVMVLSLVRATAGVERPVPPRRKTVVLTAKKSL